MSVDTALGPAAEAHAHVEAAAARSLFDEPVMLNTVRSDYVEVQDYETGDGAELVRLEVKAGQWIYYVVATTKLPDSQRVGPARLDALVHEERARCVGASDLRGAVDAVAMEVVTRRREAPR